MDLLVSTLGGMDSILGMEFITQNNVLIEGHNRLVRIPSKSGIVHVKAHELPCVDGPTIHFMLGKAWERECVGGYGMMCVMRMLDEFEAEETTKLVTSAKCIKQVLEEFPDVISKNCSKTYPHDKGIISKYVPPFGGLIGFVTRCTIDDIVGILLLVPISTYIKFEGSYLKSKKVV